jgi:hypothetical protein
MSSYGTSEGNALEKTTLVATEQVPIVDESLVVKPKVPKQRLVRYNEYSQVPTKLV